MKRKLITAFIPALFALSSLAAAQQGFFAKPLVEKKVTELPQGDLFWRIDTFDTKEQAQQAAGPLGLVAEYDVPEQAWYFEENGTRVMPFAVLNEVVLQPCGMAASLLVPQPPDAPELLFRNLQGNGTVLRDIPAGTRTLRTRVELGDLSQFDGVTLQARINDTTINIEPRHAYTNTGTYPTFTAATGRLRARVATWSRPASRSLV